MRIVALESFIYDAVRALPFLGVAARGFPASGSTVEASRPRSLWGFVGALCSMTLVVQREKDLARRRGNEVPGRYANLQQHHFAGPNSRDALRYSASAELDCHDP